MAARLINFADVQAVGDVDGLTKLFDKLGYDTSAPTEQTAAALGVAEKGQAMVRQARRIVAQKAPAGPLPALEIYWFEVTSLTAELRRMLASAFRNKPLLRYLLVLTERDFSQLDFVLVEKGIAEAATGAQVAVSHQLFSIDRRHPSRVHLRVINRLANVAPDPYAQSDRMRDAFRLAEWSEDSFNNRNLFSDYFLTKRLTEQSLFPIWHGDFKPAYKQLRPIFTGAGDVRSLPAQDFIDKFILPMIGALGFVHTAGKGDGQADYILKPAKDAPPCAALLVYPWDRPLDRKDEQLTRARAEDVPGIRVVKVLEEQKLPWAILTNGKDWRLYCAAAHSRATNYYEIDLPDALEHEDLIAFRYFYLFFRAESSVPAGGKPALLDQLREGSAAFAKELGDKLRQHIFDDVFPYLAQGFVDYRKQKFDEKTSAGDEFLTQTYDATLTLLYRLLFLLYGEALDLVPVNEPAYADLSLSRLKGEVADHAGVDGDVVETKLKARYTKSDTKLYDRIAKLVAVIDAGSKDHNVPTYNGGLFSTAPDAADKSREAEAARFLKKHKVPDFYLARALDLLARGEDSKSGRLEFIDYKSLGVRQLGSIYEGLLMYHVVIPKDDWETEFKREGLKVALVPSNKERKSTGSYFTPQHIVKYIVTQTVGPLLEEKFKAMAPKVRAAQREYQDQKKYEADRNLPPVMRKAEEIVFKKHADLVHELLDVKVLDPAMGSGHFLVETVDFVTDKLLDFIAGFPWNPLQVFVDRRVRRPIVDSLEAQGVKINEDRLTDVNLIKRLVMKRCVYGVDLNPMAVELAKVSVWLDSFTIGAPLSFMDHHFRCGNSLIGSTTAELQAAREREGVLWPMPLEPLERATRNMEQIAELSDATLTEVHRSAETFHEVLNGVEGFRVLLNSITADNFGVAHAAQLLTLGQLDLAQWQRTYTSLPPQPRKWIDQVESLAAERRLFHWDVEFPDVFFAPKRKPAEKAFDCVVGNPPYDVLKRDPDDATLTAEIDYYRQYPAYEPAMATMLNLFRLFILRGLGVLRPDGTLGMIVPLSLLSDASSAGTRRLLFTQSEMGPLQAFPQKDVPARRVFEDAKLSTLVFSLRRGRETCELSIYSHPANVFSRQTPRSRLAIARLKEFDPEMLTVPTGSAEDCDLAIRLIGGARTVPLRAVATVLVGEIDMTLDRDCVSERSAGPVLIKGAHIQRFFLREEPKQGDQEFVSTSKFERKYGDSPKAKWRENERVIFQGVTGTDDYRRIKACHSPEETFLANSVNFLRCNKDWNSHALLALLGCALNEWRFRLTSGNNNVNNYEVESMFALRVQGKQTRLSKLLHSIDESRLSDAAIAGADDVAWSTAARDVLGDCARTLSTIEPSCAELLAEFYERASALLDSSVTAWVSLGKLKEADYLGWSGRYPAWTPDEATLADGRWYPNAVAPPLQGAAPSGIDWNLIARVYPGYLLPGVDQLSWDSSAWEDFCDLLRKNKTRIGNAKVRADLTGRGAVANPTGPMKKLQETFLKFHRQIRENRAKAAELDFLIDRIVFKLFDLTLEEQKLILARVGPGRPLPPRRGRGRRAAGAAADEGPALFES